jgi:hypothetical protein
MRAVGFSLGVCIVPTLALLLFSSLALRALSATTRPLGTNRQATASVPFPVRSSPESAGVLEQWRDTQANTEVFTIDEVHQTSQELSNAVTQLRTLLAQTKLGTLQYQQNSMNLDNVFRLRKIFNDNWRFFGTPSHDQHTIQVSLAKTYIEINSLSLTLVVENAQTNASTSTFTLQGL